MAINFGQAIIHYGNSSMTSYIWEGRGGEGRGGEGREGERIAPHCCSGYLGLCLRGGKTGEKKSWEKRGGGFWEKRGGGGGRGGEKNEKNSMASELSITRGGAR